MLTSDLIIQPEFPKHKIFLWALFHIGTLGLLLPLNLEFMVKLSLGFILLSYFIVTLRRCATVWQKSPLKLTPSQSTQGSYVFPWLVIFRERSYTWILFPEMLDPTTFRRLRVRLRHPDHGESPKSTL